MKKVFFASAAILMAVMTTQANTNNSSLIETKPSKEERKEIKKEKKQDRAAIKKQEVAEVSYQSKQEFMRNFGDLPVTWSRTKYYDEADFINNGVSTTAYYDNNSELVGTTNLKTFADLPAAAQKQIKKEYKDYTVENVVFFDDNENNDTNMLLYGNQFDGQDNYFVELKKDNKTVVVQVTMDGLAGYFTSL